MALFGIAVPRVPFRSFHSPAFTPSPNPPDPWCHAIALGQSSLVPLDDDVVHFIQHREDGRGFVQPPPMIQAGARVRFGNGPFAMLEGVVDRLASTRDRVRVLLTPMGAPISVEVNSEILGVF